VKNINSSPSSGKVILGIGGGISLEAIMEIRHVTLGPTGILPDAQCTLTTDDVLKALWHHRQGDWGVRGKAASVQNAFTRGTRLRLFSVYHSRQVMKYLIVTDADRISTCILLPADY
jgi:hypothetical protein